MWFRKDPNTTYPERACVSWAFVQRRSQVGLVQAFLLIFVLSSAPVLASLSLILRHIDCLRLTGC